MQVFLGLGASSSSIEMNELIRRYGLRGDKNPDWKLVNANRGSQNLDKCANDFADYELYIDATLATAGVSASDVGFIWFKSGDTSAEGQRQIDLDPTGGAYVAYEKDLMTLALANIHAKFPNADVMLTGRHDGFQAPHLAPRAYYNYVVVQQVVNENTNWSWLYLGPLFYEQPWDVTCVKNANVHPNEKGTDIAVTGLEDWLVEHTDWFIPEVVDPPVEPPVEAPMINPLPFVAVPSENCDGVSNFYPGDWYINGCKSKKIYEQAYLAYIDKYPDGIMNMEIRDEAGKLIIFYPDILKHAYNVNADILSIFPVNTIVYIRPMNTAGEYVVPVGEDPRTEVKALPVVVPPPITGCTNPEALNYNPLATIDDGSCVMPPPPVTEGIFIKPATPEQALGVHAQNTWQAIVEEDYISFVTMCPEAGGTFPMRLRVFDDKEGTDNVKGIDVNGIPKVIALNTFLKSRNITLQVILTFHEDILFSDMQPYIDQFIADGIQVIAFEAGNESFSKMTFEIYQDKILPIRDALKTAYPGVPCIYPVGLRPIDSDLDGVPNEAADDINTSNSIGQKHADWNNKLQVFLQTVAPEYDGVAPHIYPNQREFPSAVNQPMDVLYNFPEFNQQVHDFFSDFVAEIPNALEHWRKSLDYCQRMFGKKIYVTEFGHPQAELRNTIAFGQYLWTALDAHFNKAEFWFFHNGLSPTTAGSFYPAKRPDVPELQGENVERLEWKLIRMFRIPPVNHIGKFFSDPLLFESIGLCGLYIYSSSGFCMWMTNESYAGYEVDHNDTPSGSYGFGYIIREAPVDPPIPTYKEVTVDVCTGFDTVERTMVIEFGVTSLTALTQMDMTDKTIEYESGNGLLKVTRTVTYYEQVPVIEKRTYYEKV